VWVYSEPLYLHKQVESNIWAILQCLLTFSVYGINVVNLRIGRNKPYRTRNVGPSIESHSVKMPLFLRNEWVRHIPTDCTPNIQLFRGQDLCSCCHKSLTQFAVRITKSRSVKLPVQSVAEDIFIWTARSRRIVNSINCALKKYAYLHVLTYLLAANLCLNLTLWFNFWGTSVPRPQAWHLSKNY